MKFVEDPRVKTSRRCLALAWVYYSIYLFVVMILSYTLQISPYVWGLPQWVAVANILIPFVFVIGLVFVAEKLIPDIPLSDSEEESEKPQ